MHTLHVLAFSPESNRPKMLVNSYVQFAELWPLNEVRPQCHTEIVRQRIHSFLNRKKLQKSCVVFAQQSHIRSQGRIKAQAN